MNISKYILILIGSVFIIPACQDLDIPPMNIVQDEQIFGSEVGVTSFLARIYSQLPIEDYTYDPNWGFYAPNNYAVSPVPGLTGQSVSRDMAFATHESFGSIPYWVDAYILIRNCNYLIRKLPDYKDEYSEDTYNRFLGEAYFARAWTYYALAKRYGGVPLVKEELKYPEQSIEELSLPRASEEDTWDFVSEDFDQAINLLPGDSEQGRANKFVAAGLKSRAMLHAGSIAKWNTKTLFDGDNNRLIGMPASRAVDFFRQSYDAALMVEGEYALHMDEWAANDPEAQYQNYLNIFHSLPNSEVMLIKGYKLEESVHGYDSYHVPLQVNSTGLSDGICPSLDFVEKFDGIPKTENGKIDVYNEDGTYKLFEDRMDLFANAEPRLRANVIFPNDVFKGEKIDYRRGIYINEDTSIVPFQPEESQTYEDLLGDDLVSSSGMNQDAYELPNGEMMNPAGLSGIFHSDWHGTESGFGFRKLLKPDLPKEDTKERNLEHPWIELRYAEVLLNRAEAAYELADAGESDRNYIQDAYEVINKIRERAGANLLDSQGDVSQEVVRTERRKELSFEHKLWWDMKRWRILHEEQDGRIYRVLMPFYVAHADKYIFDPRGQEFVDVFSFDQTWYYEDLPNGALNSNTNLIQNPGY